MCPNDAILATYSEGEMEEHLRTIIQTHVENCTLCGERIDRIGQARNVLLSAAEPDLTAHERFIRNRVLAEADSEERRLFNRRFTVPVPVLAGLVALVVFLTGGIAFLAQRDRGVPDMTAYYSPKSIKIDAEDLAIIKKLLEEDEFPIEVSFDLPVQNEIIIIGEPEILTERHTVSSHE